MRDITLADTVYIGFTTRSFSTGAPTTLSGTPVVSAYEDAGLTQITAGITLGVDHDGVTGFNMLTIVATGANGFEDNKDYNLVITTGTVGGVSVVGEVVGQFSIQRSPVNWANVSNPTTAVDLSGTDIQLVDTVTTYTGNTPQTGDSFARIGVAGAGLTNIDLPNQTMDITGNITGNLSGSVGSVTGSVGSVTGAVGSVTGNVGGNVVGSTASVTGAVGSVTGNVGGNVNGNVVGSTGSVTGAVGSVTGNVGGNVVGSVASVTADVGITQAGADKVWLTTSRTLTDGIQKNAAFSNFEFLMVLTSDHVTPATGLTVTGQRSIDGGAFTAVSGTIAEVSNGIYQFDALAADTNGDVITWRFSSATADDTFVTVTTS